MNIIFFSRREGRARHFNLAHPFAVAACIALVVAILATVFSLGFKIGESTSAPRGVSTWTATLAEQQGEIKELKAELQRRVDAVAMRIGQMNAHVIRLDALGKRLTQMANIDNREFDFESQPAIGGPESDIGAAMQAPDLNALLNGLEQKISSRDAQLAALENALLSKKLDEQIRPDGRPVLDGHISSYFGERQDPFTGHQAFHKGIDFASPLGSDVVAVAAGVVTFSGEKTGYGNLGRGQPWQWPHHALRAQPASRGGRRPHSLSGRYFGLRRLHGPLDRPARALRGAQRRATDRPADLHREALSAPALAAAGPEAPPVRGFFIYAMHAHRATCQPHSEAQYRGRWKPVPWMKVYP
jgi:hypothetical protein